MTLSIIVPVRNEAVILPALLARLLSLQRTGCEILLVDGGSEDGSIAMIDCAGFEVVHAPAGRARQMNAGAARAGGEILLFLHADTELPHGALDCVNQALVGGVHHWGRFNVRISGQHWMLRVIGHMMNLRSRLTGIATGDQAIFVSRPAFRAVGGFPDIPLMEDIALSKALLRLSRPACLAARVTTSGRRWETHGVWRTILCMWWLRLRYFCGADPHRLALEYGYVPDES